MSNLARRFKAERYIQPQWTVAIKGGDWVIYTYRTTGNARLVYGLVAFSGNRSKPDYHYGYPTQEALELAIDNFAGQYAACSKRKQAQRDAKRAVRLVVNHDFVVGAILYTSWGYDQTNTDFYQIISVSESRKSVVVRQIAAQTVPGSEGFMCCEIRPVKSDFVGPAIKCILTPDSEGHWHCKVEGHYAYITTDDKSHYSSWYA